MSKSFIRIQDESTYPRKFEKFLSIKQAAEASGIHYRSLLAAVNRGDLPTYHLYNMRRLVQISDIEALIVAANAGGADV